MPSISSTFSGLKARGQLALVPFIPAGYPDLATTQALLPALEEAGASAIEIGIPFSDPIADGPTIQSAFTAALAAGIRLADVFKAISEVRAKVSLPLIAMVSYSIPFRYGLDRFLAEAKQAGFDGVIFPDLPPPEGGPVGEKIKAAGLEHTLLIAPTTAPARRKTIADLCSGFVYYMSLSGITGERDKLPPDVEQNVRQIKSLTDRPVCVGFGISKPEHLAQLAGVADGAIVGSAIVKRITQLLAGASGQSTPGPAEISRNVAAYCRELLSKVR